MKKLLFLALALAIGLPVGHLVYDRLPPADVDRESQEWKNRMDALARAAVFTADQPAAEAPDGEAEIECRYDPERTSGTTPKFDCVLPDGETVKVKYGINPEIPGEVGATLLLKAAGFAADDMRIVVNGSMCSVTARRPPAVFSTGSACGPSNASTRK